MTAIVAALLVLASPPPEAPAMTEPPPTGSVWLQADATTTADIAVELIGCVEQALAYEPRLGCEVVEGCAVRLILRTADPMPIRECLDRARRRLEGLP